MRTINQSQRTAKAFTILIVIASLSWSHFAFADYSAFQNHLTSTSGPDGVNNEMVGCSTECYIEYIATSTITQFDRLDVALCRNDGSTGGVFELEVRSTASTTGPIIASSTLAINDGNVYWSPDTPGQGCNYGVEGVNEHMSTFVLNNNIQTVSGVTWWFRFRPVGNASTFLVSLNNGNTFGFGNNLYYWISNAPYKTNAATDFASPIVTGYGLGSAPTVSNQYATSSSPVVCTTFDVGCYISTAFAWAFYPSIPLSTQLSELASTTSGVVPFGYVSDLYGKFETYSNAATTTLSISVELSPLLNWLGASFPTTTVTVLSGAQLRSTLGTTMWTFTQNLIAGFLWFGFAFYVYKRSIHLL